MKTRRIWIVIVVILVAGVCSTTYTKRYVEERGGSPAVRSMTESNHDTAMAGAAPETAGATEAAMPFAADAAPLGAKVQKPAAELTDDALEAALGATGAETAASPGAAETSDGGIPAEEEASPVMDAGALASGEFDPADSLNGTAAARMAPETAAEQSAPAPNAAGVPAPGAAAGAAIQESPAESHAEVIMAGGGRDKLEVSYRNRLEELDAQIERNRKADAEKPVANSIKARAENERKLWEAELDGIMKALEGRLDSAQVEDLYAEQREWRRDKESKALEAGRRQSGSALEEVEYSVSLAESTRARAYELVEEYGAVLGE